MGYEIAFKRYENEYIYRMSYIYSLLFLGSILSLRRLERGEVFMAYKVYKTMIS
jgi:hypothetical protein